MRDGRGFSRTPYTTLHDRRIRPDAEGEREQRHDGRARCLAEHAGSEKTSCTSAPNARATTSRHSLRHPIEPAELQSGLAASVGLGYASANLLINQALDVKVQFVVQLAIARGFFSDPRHQLTARPPSCRPEDTVGWLQRGAPSWRFLL